MLAYHVTTLLIVLGAIGGTVSLIWLNWSVGVLGLVATGVLYWTREVVLLLEEIRDAQEASGQ